MLWVLQNCMSFFYLFNITNQLNSVKSASHKELTAVKTANIINYISRFINVALIFTEYTNMLLIFFIWSEFYLCFFRSWAWYKAINLPYEINGNSQDHAMKPQDPKRNLQVLVKRLQKHAGLLITLLGIHMLLARIISLRIPIEFM